MDFFFPHLVSVSASAVLKPSERVTLNELKGDAECLVRTFSFFFNV